MVARLLKSCWACQIHLMRVSFSAEQKQGSCGAQPSIRGCRGGRICLGPERNASLTEMMQAQSQPSAIVQPQGLGLLSRLRQSVTPASKCPFLGCTIADVGQGARSQSRARLSGETSTSVPWGCISCPHVVLIVQCLTHLDSNDLGIIPVFSCSHLVKITHG